MGIDSAGSSQSCKSRQMRVAGLLSYSFWSHQELQVPETLRLSNRSLLL